MTHTEARELANQFGSRMCDENGDTHDEELYCFDLDDIIAIKEALAQPEQEPVAWFSPSGNLYKTRFHATANGEQVVTPLYTHPPQRTQPNDIDLFWRAATTPEKWVRLTAEEVLQCWEKAHEPGNKEHINAIRMADEVEQALKEKNCG